MGSVAVRAVMTLLLLAGLALTLTTQGATARGGSRGVTVIVNGDRLPVQRIVKLQGKHHFGSRWTRKHRFGGSAVDQWRRHSRHNSSNVAVRAFQRSAAHHAGFHRGRSFHKPPHHVHSKHNFHKPSHYAHGGHDFKGPRVIVIEPVGTRHLASPGVVVLRGGNSAVTVLGGGKVVVLPTSPSFKHIVIGK